MQKDDNILQQAVGSTGEEAPPHERDEDLGHADVPPAHPPPHGHALSELEGAHHPPSHPLEHSHHQGVVGSLEHMKDAAAHAVEGVRRRLHLSGHEPTAAERTGEPMHMAKAAEGRNAAEDNPIDHAVHDALRLEKGERPEASAFPETLSDAVAAAQMRDLPGGPMAASATSAAEGAPAPAGAGAAAGAGAGAELVPPSPFIAEQRRSKL